MLNNVSLMGRLVADPELRHTPNDIAVTSFAIAVDRTYKNGDERQTDFLDLVAWRAAAEFICKYFRKGQMIAVQGSIQTRMYTDKEGVKRKRIEVIVDNAYFADSPKKKDTKDASEREKATPTPKDPEPEKESPEKEQGRRW